MSFPLTAFLVLITAFGDVPMLALKVCFPTTFVDWGTADVDLSSGCFLLFLSLLMVTMMLIGCLLSLEVPWMCWGSWLRRVEAPARSCVSWVGEALVFVFEMIGRLGLTPSGWSFSFEYSAPGLQLPSFDTSLVLLTDCSTVF